MSSSAVHSFYTRSAAEYLTLAKEQEGYKKTTSELMAIGKLTEDRNWREAQSLLEEVKPANSLQEKEKIILLAKVELIKGQPQSAIRLLSHAQQVDLLSELYQLQYHEILAEAYERRAQTFESLRERVKLQTKLHTFKEQAPITDGIWRTLTKLPPAEMHTLALEIPEEDELQAWVKLALIARESDIHSSYDQLLKWQRLYPNHLANQTLPKPLSAVQPYLHNPPQKIALLLPLSGPLAGPGNAIRDGLMNAAQNVIPSPAIETYDTSQGFIEDLYRQAIREGAEAVVGPLTKTDVAKIAAIDHPVPTVLLNEGGEEKVVNNMYQVGLSPLEEAKAVALKARQQGRSRAIVIAPATAWGKEVADTFSKTWLENSGAVVDQLNYNNDAITNDEAIRDLLKVPPEEESLRNTTLKKKRTKQDHFAARRQDFDMVFLIAYPSKARQILPRLRYYYLGDIPVYATSAVYSGYKNKMNDKDLDGIIFCDMPWIFKHEVGKSTWPEQLNSYNRLYALGRDSYATVTQLNRLKLFPSIGINSSNGLYLDGMQKGLRTYAWGQFKGGLPIRLWI